MEDSGQEESNLRRKSRQDGRKMEQSKGGRSSKIRVEDEGKALRKIEESRYIIERREEEGEKVRRYVE